MFASHIVEIVNGQKWWIDLVLASLLVICNVALWKASQTAVGDNAQVAGGFRAAASGGLTVVGILLPISLLTVTFGADDRMAVLNDRALAHLYIAAIWMFVSMLSGVLLLFTAATRGYAENLANLTFTAIFYSAQLIFLVAAGLRILLALAQMVNTVAQL